MRLVYLETRLHMVAFVANTGDHQGTIDQIWPRLQRQHNDVSPALAVFDENRRVIKRRVDPW
jgi:hypothetical protein